MKIFKFCFKFHWRFSHVSNCQFESALVQVLAWHHKQVTSHYFNQWWPSSLMHLCIMVTRAQWVKAQIKPVQLPLTHPPLCCIYASVSRVSIGSDNGLSPVRHQAITWNNTHLLSIRPLGTNLCEIGIKTQKCSFMKMHLKISPAKWRPFCPGGDELIMLHQHFFYQNNCWLW